MSFHNWSKPLSFIANDFITPTSIDQLIITIHRARNHHATVKAMGQRHCFSELLSGTNLAANCKHFNDLRMIDDPHIHTDSGITLSELLRFLQPQQLGPMPSSTTHNPNEQQANWSEPSANSKGKNATDTPLITAEYFVALIQAQSICAQLLITDWPDPLVNCLRSVAADNIWLSPCYQQQCLTIACLILFNQEPMPPALQLFNRIIHQHSARPHWAKLCHWLNKATL